MIQLGDLHLTNIPDEMIQWLKLRKAKLGDTVSQQICNFIYDSEDYEKFMMNVYLKHRNLNAEIEIEELVEGVEK